MKTRLLLSAVLLSTLLSGLVLAQNSTPPTPTNLEANQVWGMISTVKLTWHAPTGPWQYRIYRSANDTLDFALIGVSAMRTFHDHNVVVGSTYFYSVTSFVMTPGGMLESPRSNIAEITVGGIPHARGAIEGTVIDDTTGLPIRGVRIRFFRVNAISTPTPYTITDSLGYYHALLDTGTYLVKAEPVPISPFTPRYRPEWYDDSPHPSGATPIAVAENSLFVANFGLSLVLPPVFASVSGHVTDTVGTPLPRAWVVIKRTMQEMLSIAATTGETPGLGTESATIEGLGHARGVLWKGLTDSLGNYTAHVPSGYSYIAVASKFGYLPEYFDNKTNPMDADIIHVTGDTSGIDFSLEPNPVFQNSVSGMVKDSAGNGVVSRVVLFALHNSLPGPWPSNTGRVVHTDSLGNYLFDHVRSGRYFVLAIPFSGYLPSFYKENACGISHWSNADTVEVSGDVTGIDVCVAGINSGGLARLSGRVRTSAGANLQGAYVIALNTQIGVVGYGVTDEAGAYAIDATPDGQTTLRAVKEGFNLSEASVTVPPGSYQHGNIDFTLSPAAVTSVGPRPGLPAAFALDQNYPNPFNPTTAITYHLPLEGNVKLTVYNLLGQELATLVQGEKAAGSHTATWDGRDYAGRAVATGLYFYRLEATNASGTLFSSVRKMALVK